MEINFTLIANSSLASKVQSFDFCWLHSLGGSNRQRVSHRRLTSNRNPPSDDRQRVGIGDLASRQLTIYSAMARRAFSVPARKFRDGSRSCPTLIKRHASCCSRSDCRIHSILRASLSPTQFPGFAFMADSKRTAPQSLLHPPERLQRNYMKPPCFAVQQVGRRFNIARDCPSEYAGRRT